MRQRKAAKDVDKDDRSGPMTSLHNTSVLIDLHIVERFVYWASFISLVVYATYSVYVASYENEEFLPAYGFSPGWSFLGRQQDISNFEWHFWKMWSAKIFPCVAGHIIVSRISDLAAPQFKKWVYTTAGLASLTFLMGWRAVVLLNSHCAITYLATLLTKSVSCVWLVDLLLLATLNFNPFSDLMRNVFEDDPYEYQYYLLVFTVAMLNIRCISFGLEVCHSSCEMDKTDRTRTSSALIDAWTYFFYLPLFFCGPIFTYDTFLMQINQPSKSWPKKRFVIFAKAALRLVFWWAFYEVFTHFLYIDALLNHNHFMETVSNWVIAGIAYLNGQMFMVKYVLIFGIPSLVARFDGFDPPEGPMCISRVYLYSQMWKCFDRGLYSFLKRHIYIPLGGSSYGIFRQLLASGACFLFIFFWHGAEYYLFAWTVLNFIGISIEAAGKSITKLPVFQTYQFSRAMERRLSALLMVPLLGLSTFGYFFFMGGQEVGQLYVSRLLVGGSTSALLAISYFTQIQVSMDIQKWEETPLTPRTVAGT